MINALYIHGMGGGGDSRIPSILHQTLSSRRISVIVRTYDFDPEKAFRQIESWVDELKPSIVIGESLGAIHAIRIKNVPHILISPALNAPLYLSGIAWLTYIPGVTALLDRIYRPREGDRQRIHFTAEVLRRYSSHRKAALANSPRSGSGDYFYAFIGRRDHYRKSGVVSAKTWKKHFGESFEWYDGTHFTEEEFIYSLVVPKILNVLGIR